MKIGIDLGGSHIAIGLVDDNYEIREKRTYYLSDRKGLSTKNFIMNSIKNGIAEICESNKIKEKDIEKIGIASPGNPKDGIIQNVVNLGIEDFNIQMSLEIYYDNIEVRVANDAKCAALAEKKFGSLKEYNDSIFLCIGTGIGGAFFYNGEMIIPNRNAGFEFGHMVIDKNGAKCACGNNGCFEIFCSKKRFKEKLLKELKVKDYVSAHDLIPIVKENMNKENISQIIDEYVENLSVGLGNLVNIFEPEVICIGGSLAHYEDLLFEKLRNSMYNGRYLFNKENPPKIVAAITGNDAGIIGSTLL